MALLTTTIMTMMVTTHFLLSFCILLTLKPTVVFSQGRDNNNNNNDLRETIETIIRPFTILSSKEITDELKHLEAKYPTLVTLSTSQEVFGLPTAGTSRDCTFENDNADGCYNYYLTIEDKTVHKSSDSDSYASLPEVFLSGALHGNERVGPTTVVEVAKLLLESAWCESLPRSIPYKMFSNGFNIEEEDEESVGMDTDIDDQNENDYYYEYNDDVKINTITNLNNTKGGTEWIYQTSNANQCRNNLLTKGISTHQRQWLARLVSTRRIIIVPTANALGYDRNERTEGGIDPNRDFPFDVLNARECMQTIAGRTINELYREHLFQLSLTFHGGMEVVSYEWGAPTYMNGDSPDDVAQVEIGDGYARFAGGFEGTKQYVSGTMNDLVYPVRGGMEDWAYAGSWDAERVIQCQPDPRLHGPYPPEKTIYNNSTLRAFNMLIETSNSKLPRSHLGTTEGLLNYVPKFQSNGHIARNVRLALMAIDIVEPYVSIRTLNGVEVSDDIVPMMERDGSTTGSSPASLSCRKNKIMSVPVGSKEATVTWTVGGGFTIDFTTLFYDKWDNLPSTTDCSGRIMDGDLGLEPLTVPPLSGVTHWSKDAHNDNDADMTTSTFEATFDISNFEVGDEIAVFAMAVLDQGWTDQPAGNDVKPRVPPMSHIVNARTNVNWRHSSAGKVIEGRKEWFSIPLTILVVDDDNDGGKTVELSNRFTIPDIIIDEADLE